MTDKIHIAVLAEVCRLKGIRHVVLSPGSRSAPLVIAFSQNNAFKTHVIVDERVAGFTALGLAQQTSQTVAIICTSGTALLNLAPAVCEAFHQQVPLLLLTADRPKEFIGIGENQAINQFEIFKNYSKAFFELPENVNEAAQLSAQAIHLSQHPFCGPVHLNIPLREPLYNQIETALPAFNWKETSMAEPHRFTLPEFGKTLIVCGLQHPDAELQKHLGEIAATGKAVVIAEPVSNLHHPDFIQNPDLLLSHALPLNHLLPDTVITIGKQFVSKRLRQFLRKAAVPFHFHISMDEGKWNGIGAKHFQHIFSDVVTVIKEMASGNTTDFHFAELWKRERQKSWQQHSKALAGAPFSDLKLFEKLVNALPKNSSLQYGNSSPIRYAGLFAHPESVSVFSNRGTSGIDGCLSTAVGAAIARPNRLTFCVIGDVSFFYDSNALWNHELPKNLRIVLINNGGGNIFELIEGPQSVSGFEKYFSTRHQLNARHLAAMYTLPYWCCNNMNEWDEQWPKLLQSGSCSILEVKTDPEVNREVWRNYFLN
ncbi:MAG: 2-succinyl-5-enolpyruvyl-6-hydroxy-3-cyclohexene-1-carboxylic-acid synthase [Chitinophagales bacterium]